MICVSWVLMNPKTLGPSFKRVRLQALKTAGPSGRTAGTTHSFLHKKHSRVDRALWCVHIAGNYGENIFAISESLKVERFESLKNMKVYIKKSK